MIQILFSAWKSRILNNKTTKGIIIFTFLFFLSCNSKINRQEIDNQNKNNSKPSKYIRVKVIDSKMLDGCSYLVEKEDGIKLEPVNLPDSLKQDGKWINILFVPEKGPGICMVGDRIRLIAVLPGK